MTELDARSAVASAYAASPSWSRSSWVERIGFVDKLRQLIVDETEEMAQLISRESGFLVRDANALMRVIADELEYWGGLDEEVLRTSHGADSSRGLPGTRQAIEFREPHGVVGCIAPFNASIMGSVSKFIPALLAGNTVVLKPAPQNPLATIRLMELVKLAGLPDGALSLVVGQSHGLGKEIVEAPEERMVSFTGSTAVGLQIQAEAAKSLKRTSLELGGKGSLIILPDAELDAACAALSSVWMRQAGQICSIPSRALVHQDVYDAVLNRLLQIMLDLRYALDENDDEPNVICPVISIEQVARVEEIIDSMQPSQGLVHRLAAAPPKSGSFSVPALIEIYDTKARPFQEEFFGPALCLTPYSDLRQASALANSTDYGLANYVFTGRPDSTETLTLAKSLQSGNTVINGTRPHSSAPIGGLKLSGIGREGHPHSLYNYTEIRTLTW